MDDLGTAKNRGTKIITGTITDPSTGELIPDSSITSIVWSLTDQFGNIINGRDEVSIDPTNTFSVVLAADDNDQEESSSRIFTLVATYNSVDYGSGLKEPIQGSYVIGEYVTPEEVV